MITSVPQLQSTDRVQNQTQQNIVSSLNKVLDNPLIQGLLLSGISLSSGTSVIPHKLGRALQGWIVSDINGPATIYRSAAFNAQTLTLTSSAAVTVNIYVF